MTTRIAFTFANKDAANRWDLHRFGTVVEADEKAHRVVVETDVEWITVPMLRRAVLSSGYTDVRIEDG